MRKCDQKSTNRTKLVKIAKGRTICKNLQKTPKMRKLPQIAIICKLAVNCRKLPKRKCTEVYGSVRKRPYGSVRKCTEVYGSVRKCPGGYGCAGRAIFAIFVILGDFIDFLEIWTFFCNFRQRSAILTIFSDF